MLYIYAVFVMVPVNTCVNELSMLSLLAKARLAAYRYAISGVHYTGSGSELEFTGLLVLGEGMAHRLHCIVLSLEAAGYDAHLRFSIVPTTRLWKQRQHVANCIN